MNQLVKLEGLAFIPVKVVVASPSAIRYTGYTLILDPRFCSYIIYFFFIVLVMGVMSP